MCDAAAAVGDSRRFDITDGAKPDWEAREQLKRYIVRYSQQLRDISGRTPVEPVYLITAAREWTNPDDQKDKRVVLDLDGAFRAKVAYFVDATFYTEKKVSRSGDVKYNLVMGPKKGLPTEHTNFGDSFPTELENPTIPKILDLIDYSVYGKN